VNPIFTINFRREAFEQAQQRVRHRVVMLGLWVSYFGVVGVLMGLYGLNCMSLRQRVRQIEVQANRLRMQQGAAADWSLASNEVEELRQFVQNPTRWRDRLSRIPLDLPANAKLTSLAVNPQNLSTAAEQNVLVITGVVRPASGQDRMQSVMQIVGNLRADSIFAAGYQNVRLTSTRLSDAGDGSAEFVVECR
jgi:hypothetical protein